MHPSTDFQARAKAPDTIFVLHVHRARVGRGERACSNAGDVGMAELVDRFRAVGHSRQPHRGTRHLSPGAEELSERE